MSETLYQQELKNIDFMCKFYEKQNSRLNITDKNKSKNKSKIKGKIKGKNIITSIILYIKNKFII